MIEFCISTSDASGRMRKIINDDTGKIRLQALQNP